MKNNKGITMISLVITIIVLIIVTSVTIYNGTAQLGIKRVNNLYADIDSISTKVAEYYLKNEKLPVFENKYIDSKTNLEKLFRENGATTNITNVNDDGDYYAIDLTKLDNLTLNYGDDYKEWTNTSTAEKYQNIYIINSVTHEIYFPHGVRSGDKHYFARFPDENGVSPIELEDIEDNWTMSITNISQNNIDENNISLVADITLNNLEENYDLNSLEYAWTETNDESNLENISFTKFNVNEGDKTATIASKSLSNTAKKYYLCVKIADINGKTSYKYTNGISVPYVSLPNEYQKVEYIESTGTQYIDTGYYSNSETRTILEFSYIMTNNDQYSNGAIFGSANNGNGRPGYSICVTLDNKIYYRNSEIAESFNTNDDIVPNEIYTVDVFKNDIKINNNCYTSDMGLLGNKQNYSSFLFARQQPEWTNNVYSILIGRIYMCKIYENEVLQRDFIPCLDDNGIACMYDTVTNTTFYNKGSGTFSYKIKE